MITLVVTCATPKIQPDSTGGFSCRMRSDRLAVRRCFSVKELDFEVFVDTPKKQMPGVPQKMTVWVGVVSFSKWVFSASSRWLLGCIKIFAFPTSRPLKRTSFGEVVLT